MISSLYLIALACVIAGHFFFDYMQWFKWTGLCARLTDLSETEAVNTIGFGRSFASYNASVGAGLVLSLWLAGAAEFKVQAAVLVFVVLSADDRTF